MERNQLLSSLGLMFSLLTWIAIASLLKLVMDGSYIDFDGPVLWHPYRNLLMGVAATYIPLSILISGWISGYTFNQHKVMSILTSSNSFACIVFILSVSVFS